MGLVEIHIKDDKIQKIQGNDAYVIVHDHDINERTTMKFKKQEILYDNIKNTGHYEPKASITEEE